MPAALPTSKLTSPPSRKNFSASAVVFVLYAGLCSGLIETCEDLKTAFELTATQDVVVEIVPNADIECDTFTNMTMTSNTLTVSASEDISRFGNSVELVRIRFEVINGAKLIWEPHALFDGLEEEEENKVDGGAVFVGEGSTVRFLNNLQMTDVGIINETRENSDYASFLRSGGCVWTDGYFRVDGTARFERCEVVGAGESPPGPGGAVYVGETGSVLFNGGVDISETSISDDGGGRGGGIYNLGKVNIKGSSRFVDLRASNGAAIYNGEGAQFNFRNGASAFFRDLTNRDSAGSALFNLGYFKFSGPALIVDAEAPAIVAGGGSETILSEDSAFWDLAQISVLGTVSEPEGDAIFISDSAEITIPSSVSFVGYEEPSQ